MRSALWPHAVDDHRREIQVYLEDARDRSVVLVAERPKEAGLSGFLEARLRDYAVGCSSSPVAYIEGWYVDPEFRRAGVGTALALAAEEWARDLGLTELASDAEIENSVGLRAHLALGFQQAGRIIQFRKSL